MKVINVLLVEDDELDVMDVKRTFDKMNFLYNLTVARNGEEALSFMTDVEKGTAANPDVAIVDINMPRMNGFEFLQKIRNTEASKDLKCFILTTSSEPVDRKQAEDLSVSGYLVKPLKLNNPSSIDAFNLTIDLMNMKK